MLTQIILINKDGSIKECKALSATTHTLYRKCGYKKPDGFDKRVEWKIKDGKQMKIEVWAKDKGKSNIENKYVFPPPINTNVYFGTCAVIITDDQGEIKNLTIDTWNKFHKTLYSGFAKGKGNEDIIDLDINDEVERINTPKKKNEEGYLKVGFMTDMNSDDEEELIAEVDDDDDVDDEDDEGVEDAENIKYDNDEDCFLNEDATIEDKDDINNLLDEENNFDENTNSDTELEEEEYYYSDEE